MSFALYHPGMGWLVDTCAGGSFSWDVVNATWWDSELEAFDALRGAEIPVEYFTCTRVK